MSTKYIGVGADANKAVGYNYQLSDVDSYIFDAVNANINCRYPMSKNLLINAREFGLEYQNTLLQDALALDDEFDNMFIVSAFEPWCLNPNQTTDFIKNMHIPNVFWIGNFDDTDPSLQFHFSWGIYSALAWGNNYKIEDLILKDIRYKFMNYNRDPKHYRIELVDLIEKHKLDKCGIVTLGGRHIVRENVSEVTNCYQHKSAEFTADEIPNDNSSLGTMQYWNHHFLNVVSETRFYWWDDVFISEKSAKPIIGMRPFIINGNWKTYSWLRNNGFKTFEKYFPFAKFENLHEDDVHPNIIKVLEWVCNQPINVLQSLYNEMLPDLLHNRARLFEFAEEEHQRVKNILL